MPADTITPTAAPAPHPANSRPIDKDSIYYSKERWRLIPQRTGRFTVQYLVIDTYENEIVGTHPKMSQAMDHRDRLEGRTVELPAVPVPNYNLPPYHLSKVVPDCVCDGCRRLKAAARGSKCEELAHQ
jgi:hypothetical protein